MTYERFIIAADEIASELSNAAYKLLWRLYATAIHMGQPDVSASVRQLANGLKQSKESTATAIRELALYIRVEARDGEGTTFFLPPDWFPPQRTLFTDDTLGGDIHSRPGNQDTSVLFSRTLASQNPGHQRPNFQDGRPKIQDTSVLESRTVVPFSRTLRPNFQDADPDCPIRNAPARNRSIESESSALSEVVVIIDRAWACVEIPGDKEAAAALLSEALYAYKRDLGPLGADSVYPDTGILAKLLCLAPYDETARVLRTLREKGKPCGDQDAWFFTVIAQKVYGAPPNLTRSRMAAGKSKARPYESKPSLFGEELLQGVAGAIRKIG